MTSTDTGTKKKKKGDGSGGGMGEGRGRGFAHGGGGRRRFSCSFLSLAGAATSIIFVATKHLSRQNICRDKHAFVATKDIFCRNKHVFVVTFVAIKIILVAAPANDNIYALHIDE